MFPSEGTKTSFSFGQQMTGTPGTPAGEWNTFVITCRGRAMALEVNGETTCTLADCEVPKGFVGVEAEGYRVEFRSLKVRPLE